MSKYADNIEQKTEVKRKESARREALSRFYYDIAKIVFAGLVVGVVLPFIEDPTNPRYIYTFIFGVYVVWVLAYMGNKILKQ